MRKSARALALVFISFVGAIGLAIGAAFSAALSYGAVALIVPGTGTPNANIVANYRENARDYYFQGTSCSNEANCPTATALKGIDYPASFFPLVIFPGWCRSGPEGCDKWDESVGQGAYGGPLGTGLKSQLETALATPYNPTTPGERDIIVFGYSQGGAVVSKVLNDYPMTDEEQQRIQVITIGGIENPDGGLWQRLAFLRYIPILDVTFAPPMPIDKDLKTTTIGFEYDPVVYAPRYWGNPLALLNAIAALETVHGTYLDPNGNDGDTPGSLAYGYTPPGATGPNLNPIEDQLDCSQTGHPENCRYDKVGNTYIMIPATSLPMYDLLTSLLPAQVRPFVKPFIDLVTPVTKVLVDLGYDWSGDPGTPTPLSILPFNPFQNPLSVGVKLAGAAVQGVQNFIAALGQLGAGASTLAPAPSTAPQIQAPGAQSRVAPVPTQVDKLADDVSQQKKSGDDQSKSTTPIDDGQPVDPKPPVTLVVDNGQRENGELEKKDELKQDELNKDDDLKKDKLEKKDDEPNKLDDDKKDGPVTADPADPPKSEPTKNEPSKNEPAKNEPAKNDTAKNDTADKKDDNKKAA